MADVAPVKIGILARSEDRGIGIQTWEAFRHLPNPRALVVDPGRYGHGFPMHPERFDTPTATAPIVAWRDDQTLDERIARDWLHGLDVVYIVETAYDPRFYEWSSDAGAATILHTNPELHHANEAALATAVWCPTPWRIDQIDGARLVPYPVAVDRFPHRKRLPVGAPRVLHVAGHAAYADRNGTKLVAAATPIMNPPISVWVVSQDENVALSPQAHRFPAHRDYWRIYDLADILLMPRRFGGLCLPIQEAKAAGLVVVALDTSPHDWYECVGIPAEPSSWFPSGSGDVTIFNANPVDVAAAVNDLTFVELGDLSAASRDWAHAHSWESLTRLWMDEFEKARADL
jgi:hypothetical protein